LALSHVKLPPASISLAGFFKILWLPSFRHLLEGGPDQLPRELWQRSLAGSWQFLDVFGSAHSRLFFSFFLMWRDKRSGGY